MTFLIRRIALKANGEEIVRDNRVEGEAITIGRDSGCDIHLPDLAVDPDHARVTASGRDELMITSIGDQPFGINGRSATRGAIDPDRGAELTFGGHRITVSRDAETGDAIFSIRRVEAISDAVEEKDVSSVFTLKGLLPGKRLGAWTFAILILVACLAWPVYSWATFNGVEERPAGFHGDELWMSGQLSEAHANLEDDCQACHVEAFVAVRDEACMDCHQDDAHAHITGLAANDERGRLVAARGEPTGFAAFQRAVAEKFNRPAGRCVECHIEHTGAGDMPDTPQKFCTDCHDGMSARLTDTKLPDASDFGTGHPAFRPALLATTGDQPRFRRTTLDGDARENNGLKFTHAQHMSKTNGIAQMVRRRGNEYDGRDGLDCNDCHTLDSSGTRYAPVVMEQSCQTCHSLGLELVDGTTRTLRHGEPEQVAADLRAYFRSGRPPAPSNLSTLSRRQPGDANRAATARDYARAVNFRGGGETRAVNAVFSRGGACYDCHVITRDGPRVTNGFSVADVAWNPRYFRKGWFTHDAHTKYQCVDCHVDALVSNDATEVLVPGLDGDGGCRDCHVGGTGDTLNPVNHPIESDCAMCHDYHAGEGAPSSTLRRETIARDDAPTRVSLRR